MMASGEIRLSTTTMRRMPVLAQSQDAGTAQSQTPGSIPQASGPADYQIDTPVTVTSNSTAGAPLFAQVIDPVPFLGIDEYLESPAMQALRQGRLPTPAEEAASQPRYGTRIGVPPPLPPPEPSNPLIDFLNILGDWLGKFWGLSPAAPPVCPAGPVCGA